MPVARDTTLLNAVSRVFFEEVREWLRGAAGGIPDGAVSEAAAVTYVQRFGGSLNLNPHLHMLVADGVFGCREDGSAPEFVATAAPTRDDLRAVIARVIERLQVIERRRAQRAASESCEVSDDGMEGLRRAAGGRGTFARVDDEGAHDDAAEERALAPLRMRSHGLVAEVDGFNLHAGVCVAGDDRAALERLCRQHGATRGGERAGDEAARWQRRGSGEVAAQRGGDAPGDDADGVHRPFERAGDTSRLGAHWCATTACSRPTRPGGSRWFRCRLWRSGVPA